MLNTWIGIGRLARDAEVSTVSDGTPQARFTIAVDRFGKKSDPDWVACQVYGDKATKLAPFLMKGKLISVEGRLSTYKKEDGITRFSIRVNSVDFVSSDKAHGGQDATGDTSFPPAEESGGELDDL